MGYILGLTHDRIVTQSPSTGILSKPGIVFGGNALQSIMIGRHTPHEPVQAIGFLGIVDYHTGVITSDIQLDCILTENCVPADVSAFTNSAYKYAAQQMQLGAETYVLTSCNLAFQSGSPATVNYGLLTGTLASYLATQNAPAPLEAGEEAEYAVVMGDDGSGIILSATFNGSVTNPTGTIPIINSSGVLASATDSGIPAGVQSIQFNTSINREQILDIRTTSAVQFVTTYPIDVSMDCELYCPPAPSGGYTPGNTGYTGERTNYTPYMNSLVTLGVVATNLNKHPATPAPLGTASSGTSYVQVNGLTLDDQSEGIQVGRFLVYTFRYRATDLILPLPENPTAIA